MALSGSMQDRAYEMLRTYILNLVLQPGMSFTIQEMADRMEDSRTPVREALIRLQKDALVTFTSQRCTLVTQINLKRVEQERFMREKLEIAVVDEFMQTDCHEFIPRLEGLMERQQSIAENGTAEALVQLDDEFHSVFYEAAGQSLTWEMLGQYNTHYRRVRLLNLHHKDMRGIVSEHQELVRTICDGNREKATHLIRMHLHKLDDEVRGLRMEYPDYFEQDEKPYNPYRLI